MKHFNKFLLLLLLCCSAWAQAQNSRDPWLVGLGVHGPQMTIGDQKFYKEYFNAKNWNVVPAAATMKAFRHIKYGISVGTSLSLGTAKRFPTSSLNDGQFFLDWDVDVKYSFANGYILKEKCWFDPYLLIGGGLSKWGNVKGDVEAGAGFNIWVVRNFGFFAQAVYNFIPGAATKDIYNEARPSYMHHSFGVVARFGKGKDTDKDGVPDTEDKCPNDPGKPELGGCPDTDGDGIVDKDDKCPAVAGLAAFMGCPDTDGDGIVDAEDACPNDKGSAEMKGCPDADGDGVADKDDLCPTTKGLAALQGCPDTDGDGIADKDDACPNDKGTVAGKGCPDSDGDGILDKDDKCPNVYGVVENNGCPKPALTVTEKQEVQQKLNFAAKNIFFETGKDLLKKESYDDLDNVVGIMKKYDFVKLAIEGHTDNVGVPEANVALSNKRAAAVVDYLIKKGVAPDRMLAAGFGPSKPVGDNKTAAGRALNRRVEILIKE